MGKVLWNDIAVDDNLRSFGRRDCPRHPISWTMDNSCHRIESARMRVVVRARPPRRRLRRQVRPAGRLLRHAGRGGDARRAAGGADDRVRRHHPVPRLHHRAAAGRGLRHRHPRPLRRPRAGRAPRSCGSTPACSGRRWPAWSRSARRARPTSSTRGSRPTRMKKLLEAGAASKAEMEQAQTALETAEAQIRAMDAQIREQRVALGYHQVTAPTAGVVGRRPRPGRRQRDPLHRAHHHRPERRPRGLHQRARAGGAEPEGRPARPPHGRPGQRAHHARRCPSCRRPWTRPPSRCWPRPLAPAGGFRTDQYVRARVVWTEAPALTVPVVALNRINGVFFAFVAEPGEGGQTVARQRAVVPGPMVGNDYVVRSGLKAGEKLIVSGVQKIRDGAPVASRRAVARARAREGRLADVLRRLHPPPDPGHRLLAGHHPGRRHLHPHCSPSRATRSSRRPR